MYWKYTWQITPDIKFMHTYHDDIWVIPDTPSLADPFETINTFSGRNPSVTFGNITHVLSDSTFYDVRISGFYAPADKATINGDPSLSHVNDGATGVSSGGAYFSGGAEQARTAVNGKLSHYATGFLGGDHDFKFGIQYVNGWSQGHYGYTSNIAYYTYYGEPYYAYFGELYNYGGQFLNTGLFVEDMMTIGDRVTVQIGLRYDRIDAKVQDIDQKDQGPQHDRHRTGAGDCLHLEQHRATRGRQHQAGRRG